MAHYGKKLFSLIFLLIFAIVLLALFPQCAFAEEEGEKMASYTTAYSASFAARAHNIELAASLLDGQKVGAGAEFSFNAAVGARTSERGFESAKVILNGEYVDGVGGGVCQVSSTLYNAWVLAGLAVRSVRAHSLPSGYVPMSQDATVSEYIDLVLLNDSRGEVTIRAAAREGKLTIALLGKRKKVKVTLASEVLAVVPAGEDIEYVDELPAGKDMVIARKPRQGYRTRLLATYVYEDGRSEKKELRRDFYRPTDVKILMIAD